MTYKGLKYEGLFWCKERKDYFNWKDYINYYKNIIISDSILKDFKKEKTNENG